MTGLATAALWVAAGCCCGAMLGTAAEEAAECSRSAGGGGTGVATGPMLLQTRALEQRSASASSLWASGQELDSLLQRAAFAPGPHDNTTRELLRAFRLCGACAGPRRFGEPHDGGYVMCTEGLGSGLLAAYSYGINGFDGWGMDVAKSFGVPIYEFDCTNPNRPEPCDGCQVHFTGECLRGEEEKPKSQLYHTLGEHLEKHGHAAVGDASLLLKIDIEGAEWPVLAQVPPATLRKFRQVVVEFHGVERTEQHPLYLRALRSLLGAGLQVVHLHGNNFGGEAKFGEYSVPNVLEVTLSQGTAGESKCAAEAHPHLAQDATNNAAAPELPEPKLPL